MQPSRPWRPAGAAPAAPRTVPRLVGSAAVAEPPIPERRRAATSTLGRELLYTLRQAQNHLVRLPRAEPDALLLLRAGRACWLIDDADMMCVFYREAAAQLQAEVEAHGRRTGTAPEFWRLALGALWMTATYSDLPKEKNTDQGALRMLTYQILDVGQRLALDAAQPLDRQAIELVRLRAAWYAGDAEVQRLLTAAEQRAAAMDVNNRGLWTGERDQLTLAAIKSVTRERPERMAAALAQLDEHLWANATRPPTIMDLVDEELLALEAAAVKAGVRAGGLRTAPKRGARRADVGGH